MSRLDPTLDTLRQCKQVFDVGWMALLLMVSLCAGLVAYVDPARFDAVPVGWGLFGMGALYALVSKRLSRIPDPQRLSAVLFLSQLVGVSGLGLLWYALGGLHNPAMLLAFGIPMCVACVHRTSWQIYSIGLACIFVVTLGALIESPELRWYLAHGLAASGLAGPPELPGLAEWLDGLPALRGDRPFAEAAVPPGQGLTLLTSFAIGIAMLALAVDGFRGVLEGLLSRVARAEQRAADRARRVSEAFRSSAVPTLLVYVDSVSIAEVSDRFEQDFDQPRAQTLGRNLFEVVDWSHPDTVEDLIRAGGGEVKSMIQRIDGRQSIQRIQIQRLRHDDRECALITLSDTSDRWLLDRVLGSQTVAAFLIGPDERITHMSEQTLLPGAIVGSAAASALALEGLEPGWWQPAPLSRDRVRVVVDGTRLVAHCETLRMPGERQGWTLVTFVEPGGPR